MKKSDGSDGRRNNRGPVETQFKPGEKRYRPGRPPGSQNRRTIVEKAYAKKLWMGENGKRMRVSRFEAGVNQIAAKFAAGDPKAIGPTNDFYKSGLLDIGGPAAAPDQLTERDTPVIAEIIRRIRQAEPVQPEPVAGEEDENSVGPDIASAQGAKDEL